MVANLQSSDASQFCIPCHPFRTPFRFRPVNFWMHARWIRWAYTTQWIYVNFMCYKLHKTSDMALGRKTTNGMGRNCLQNFRNKNTHRTSTGTIQKWSQHTVHISDGIFGTIWKIILIGNDKRMRANAHELNFENMQMPQVLQFIRKCIFKSFDCISVSIIGIPIFSFVYISMFIDTHKHNLSTIAPSGRKKDGAWPRYRTKSICT